MTQWKENRLWSLCLCVHTHKRMHQFRHSVMSGSVTSWTAAHQASRSVTNPRTCSNSCQLSWCCLQPSHPLSPLLPSVFPSIGAFSNESALCIRWPKYWSFSISPSDEYFGLISFRIDWFDLFAVQGTLKSLLQHHSSKASILRHSDLFMVQHP